MSISDRLDRTPAEYRVKDAGQEYVKALSALAAEDRDTALDAATAMWRTLGNVLGVDY